MPWPLVFAGVWTASLITYLGVLAWDCHLDRKAEERIQKLGTMDAPITLDPDAVTDKDREAFLELGVIW
jgi:hypothetical protein